MHITVFDLVRIPSQKYSSSSPHLQYHKSTHTNHLRISDYTHSAHARTRLTRHSIPSYSRLINAHVTAFPYGSRSLFVRPQLSCLAPNVRISVNTSLRPTNTLARPIVYSCRLPDNSRILAQDGRRDQSPQREDPLKQVHGLLLLDSYVLPVFGSAPHTIERGLGKRAQQKLGAQRIWWCRKTLEPQWTDNC
jgi:hypothetical protein